jgi:hypothetical protein
MAEDIRHAHTVRTTTITYVTVSKLVLYYTNFTLLYRLTTYKLSVPTCVILRR